MVSDFSALDVRCKHTLQGHHASSKNKAKSTRTGCRLKATPARIMISITSGNAILSASWTNIFFLPSPWAGPYDQASGIIVQQCRSNGQMLLGKKQSVYASRATSDVKQRFKLRTNLHRPRNKGQCVHIMTASIQPVRRRPIWWLRHNESRSNSVHAGLDTGTRFWIRVIRSQ